MWPGCCLLFDAYSKVSCEIDAAGDVSDRSRGTKEGAQGNRRQVVSSMFTAFLSGFGIGVVVSLVGAALSYWFGLRRTLGETKTPLLFLMLAVLGLGAAGAVVLLGTVWTGGIAHALVTGAGVVIGFTVVFALLLFAWVRAETD